MRRILPLLVLLSFGFAPAPLPRRPDKTSDVLKMQGEWRRVELYNGTSLMPQQGGEVVVAISGGTMSFSIHGEEHSRWEIKLGAQGCIDLVGAGESKGNVLYGVYRLEGDTLKHCYSSAGRPAGLGPAAGACHTVLKRR
jgi:uncharacterized protein (TIGR03067 family)